MAIMGGQFNCAKLDRTIGRFHGALVIILVIAKLAYSVMETEWFILTTRLLKPTLELHTYLQQSTCT